MGFNLESGKNREINETPEVKGNSEQLSETEETAEKFDDCSLNKGQDCKGNEVNAETLKEAEENYDDCEAKVEEMEEKNPELAEEDDFRDCGKETEGQYVAEVTYTTDGEVSEAEVDAELQEAYNECDDPEDVQQLKENANENEHIEVHNAEVIERPEKYEMGDDVTEEEYEEAQKELDEAQENLEAQQEASQEYQEDLENQINKHEDEVPEGTENINNETSEGIDSDAKDEVSENTEDAEGSDEVEETTEETEDSDEVDETTEETEDSGEVDETTENAEDFGEVEETTEEIESEDLEQMDGDSNVEASKIDEENLSENVSQEVEEETDTELSDETKEQIAEEVADEIDSEAESNKITAAETGEIVEDEKAKTVESVEEQSEAIDDEIEQKADEIAENDNLTEEEAKEQITEEVSESANEEHSDDDVEAMVEEKSETIEESIEEKAEEQEAVDAVEETADKLEDEKMEQLSEQSERSLQERIDDALERDEVSEAELRELAEENARELDVAMAKQRRMTNEITSKFDEVLSKERGTEEYKEALREYNSLKDKKEEVDERTKAITDRQEKMQNRLEELNEAKTSEQKDAVEESTDNVLPDSKGNSNEIGMVEKETLDSSVNLGTPEVAQKTSFDLLNDYMREHNYGPDDFSEYSKDPEWRILQRNAFPNYELPAIDRETAFNQLGEYMRKHDYGSDDFDKYSQDPVWRELQNYAFPDYELPPITDVSDISSFNDLSAYLETKYGIEFDESVRHLDFETVKSAIGGVESIIIEYPDVGDLLKKGVTSNSGVMSCTGSTLSFNPEYFSDNSTLENTCKEMSEKGFWVANSTPESIGVHEAAHGVEWALIQANPEYTSDSERVCAWNQCTEAKKIVSKACENVQGTPFGEGKNRKTLITSISEYALESDSETMAEAFADVSVNGTNANPLSMEIVRLSKEQINKYKGG